MAERKFDEFNVAEFKKCNRFFRLYNSIGKILSSR